MVQLGATHTGEIASTRRAPAVRLLAFCAIAAFVLLAPMFPHVFNIHGKLLRPWMMYSDVGVGLLKGDFRIEQAGATRTVAPLELMGLERYPRLRHYRFEQRVLHDGDLGRIAATYCATLPAGARLSFGGAVGTRNGWRPLKADDLCGSTHAGRD